MDQLHSDKSSLERKLQDAEVELKSIDDSHRQVHSSLTRQSSTNHTEDDSSNLEHTLSNNKNTFHIDDNDDDEGLSDTDSDVVQMKQTLIELKRISSVPTSNNINEKKTELANNNTSPVIRNLSFERTSNQSMIDSGRWSNTMLSTIGNNTFPLGYPSSISKNNFWQSQPSLITRDSVLKAARDVLPPGVIDHLTAKYS